MYPSFAYFNWYIDGILSNYEDFIEKFSEDVKEVRENYNAPDHIKTNIDKCFEELETGALSLMEEDKYTDAKSLYEKLDDYRKRMGEKEDSEKRKEYEEKIEECNEKIRLKKIVLFIILLIFVFVLSLYYIFFRRKRLLKERTSKGFNLQLDKAEKMLEYDVKSAAQSAGRRLELLLKTVISKDPNLAKAWKKKYPKKITKSPIPKMIKFLKDAQKIDENEFKDLEWINHFRNKASHAEFDPKYINTLELEPEEITYGIAKRMIDGVRDYVNKFLD